MTSAARASDRSLRKVLLIAEQTFGRRSRLEQWLQLNGIRTSPFAKQVGCTPAMMFGLINGEYWIGRDLAKRIFHATDGNVTPNDFLFLDEARVQ